MTELIKYENWMLSAEWGRMFPHLAQYVNIEVDEELVNNNNKSCDSSVQTEN